MKIRPRIVHRWSAALVWALLLLFLIPSSVGVSCMDDSDMIDRHEQKLDEEDE